MRIRQRCFFMRYIRYLLIFVMFFNFGCSCSRIESHYENESNSNIEESENPILDNPYDEGTGHAAGYEWAKDNDVYDCHGNSQSFIAGCEEYLSQKSSFE